MSTTTTTINDVLDNKYLRKYILKYIVLFKAIDLCKWLNDNYSNDYYSTSYRVKDLKILYRIKYLDRFENIIPDISFCSSLVELSISHTNISKLPVLNYLKQLKYIDFSYTDIKPDIYNVNILSGLIEKWLLSRSQQYAEVLIDLSRFMYFTYNIEDGYIQFCNFSKKWLLTALFSSNPQYSNIFFVIREYRKSILSDTDIQWFYDKYNIDKAGEFLLDCKEFSYLQC